jgi:hypothetical protein
LYPTTTPITTPITVDTYQTIPNLTRILIPVYPITHVADKEIVTKTLITVRALPPITCIVSPDNPITTGTTTVRAVKTIATYQLIAVVVKRHAPLPYRIAFRTQVVVLIKTITAYPLTYEVVVKPRVLCP